MTLQRSCHARITLTLFILLLCPFSSAEPARSDSATHDYPTYARVEYVNECVVKGGKLSNLYQCSCAIDRIAKRLSYDDFVEAATFVRYASQPGERGGIFRDPERAKTLVKLYRDTESAAFRSCGL